MSKLESIKAELSLHERILFAKEEMAACRYLGQIDIGGQPFSEVMKGIELFAGKVAPFIMATK